MRADSDMDFLVTMQSPCCRDFINLWHSLEDHFYCNIDIGEVHRIKPAACASILREVQSVEETVNDSEAFVEAGR